MLETKLLKTKLNNPLILASGILGVTSASLKRVANNGAGAVTTKSISIEQRKGHPNPTVLANDNFVINAVGLSNSGIEKSKTTIQEYKKQCKTPIIASIFASNTKDFGKLAKEISKTKPKFIEANISCPNVKDEFGIPFSADPKAASLVTRTIKKNTKIPVIIKLSPNVPNITQITKAIEKAGANIINMGNTAGPGMVIDINTHTPILSNKSGGISGPIIKPITIRYIYEIYKTTKLPIVGTGGVTTGKDAIEMIMAGATCIGIGSGVYYRGINIFEKVNKEITAWLKKHKYKSLKEIRGIAHV